MAQCLPRISSYVKLLLWKLIVNKHLRFNGFSLTIAPECLSSSPIQSNCGVTLDPFHRKIVDHVKN